jgi:hypothetical protein
MQFPRGLGRRAVTATAAVLAVLASSVVTASPAAALVTAPSATLSDTTLYRGQPFTISYGDIFCDGSPSSFDRVEVGIAGTGQTSIYTGITAGSSLHVPTHAPIGLNSVLGVVSSGACAGQIVEFATFEVIPMAIDVTVASNATLYRPSDTATLTATITATGNPTQSLDGHTAVFRRGGTTVGSAPIVGDTATLTGAAVGEVGWHHLEVHVDSWQVNELVRTPYEVAAIPVTLAVTGPDTVAANAPATFTITASADGGAPDLAGLTATLDGDPVTVDAVDAAAAVTLASSELAIGAHTLAVALPAAGDFGAAATTFAFDVDPFDATLHAHVPGPVIYGAPFDIAVQVTSAADEPLDGTVSTTVAGNTLTASVASDGTATIAVPADVAATLYASPYTFPVSYDGGSSHRPETTSAAATIAIAPTYLEIGLNTITAGTPIDATITVTADHGTPVGYVSFSFDGVAHGGTMLLIDGSATVTVPATTAGTHTVSVTYWGTGGTRYDYSEIATSVPFSKAATRTSVTYGADPPSLSRTTRWSASVCTSVANSTVTATPADGTEIQVTVLRDGEPYTDFTAEATSGACFGTGEFTSDYPAGTYTLTATFPGDAYLAPSSGTATLVVEKATTAMSVEVDAQTALPQVGTELTATLSAPGAGRTQDGTVTFYANGEAVGTAPVGAATNTATITAPLDAGAVSVTAEYSGDEYHRATTADLTLEVDQRLASMSVTVTPPTVTVGEVSRFTAQIVSVAPPMGAPGPTGPGGPGGLPGFTGAFGSIAASAATAPTGTVTFLVNASPVGTAAVIDGVATLDHTFAVAGSYLVTATYSGDTNTTPAAATDPAQAANATAVAAPAPAPSQAPPTAFPAPEAPPTPAARPAAGDLARAGAVPGRSGAMAHTGSDTSVVLGLAAVLLIAGIATSALAGRRRRISR